MSVIGLPNLPWQARVKLRQLDFGVDLVPALGGPRQRISRLGSRYAIDVQMPTLDIATFATWNSARLKAKTLGAELAIKVPQPLGVYEFGSGVVVNGAGQAGSSLQLGGMLAAVTVPAGLFYTMTSAGRRYLHMVTDPVTSDGTGVAILQIAPMLRVVPTAYDPINYKTPDMQGFLDGQTEWDDQYRRWQSFSFSLVESA